MWCAPPCRLYSSCMTEFACIVGEGRRLRWFELDAPCPVMPCPHASHHALHQRRLPSTPAPPSPTSKARVWLRTGMNCSACRSSAHALSGTCSSVCGNR